MGQGNSNYEKIIRKPREDQAGNRKRDRKRDKPRHEKRDRTTTIGD